MNRKNARTSKSKVLMTVITVVFICLIFLQSAMSAETSSAESSGLTTFINNFFIGLKLNVALSHDFVRKLAHFAEFFILGILLTSTACTYKVKPYRSIFSLLFFGLAAAVSDETIQIFAVDRGSSVQDILLDFFGILVGVGICLLFICIKNAVRR